MRSVRTAMTYDVTIVGSGFASTILGRILAGQGRRVLILEKGSHPRFALGESSTPLGSLCLERLAARWGLPDLGELATYGRWIECHPDLERGLKRGFTFWFHQPGKPFESGRRNRNRLLVAASPEDRLADTHWLREDVDTHLAARAVADGAELRENTEVVAVRWDGARAELELQRGGRSERILTELVVDGSGRAGVVAESRGVRLREEPAPFASSLVFAHFDGVEELDRVGGVLEPGPYPDERAAVHHLIEEGWIYSLRFDGGVVSAGLVSVEQADGEADAWERLTPEQQWRQVLGRYPSLNDQLAEAVPRRPLARIHRMQYRRERATGPGWVALPHAYAFFEPLFSTGIAWSLLAVERLAEILVPTRPGEERGLLLRGYAEILGREADQIESLIHGAYLARRDPELFAAQSFLYFAQVSFAEVRQRMIPEADGRGAAIGFLGAGQPAWERIFTEAVRRLRPRDRSGFPAWVRETIRPWNVVGLADPERNNLYPVDLDLLLERAGLLGLSREEAARRLPLLRGGSVAP